MNRKQERMLKYSIGLVLAIIFSMYMQSRGMNFWQWFN